MQESANELKVGSSKEFTVDGKTLVLEPIPYGRLKKVMESLVNGVGELTKVKDMTDKDIAAKLPELIMNQMENILPLLFDQKRHPWLSKEWLENHLSLPVVMDIAESAIKINGLMDFFGKLRALQQPAPPSEIKPLIEKEGAKTPATR